MEKLNLDKKIRQLILGKLDEYKNDDNQPTREQFIRMWAIWFAYKDGHVTTGGARQTHKKQRRLRKTRMRRHTKGS